MTDTKYEDSALVLYGVSDELLGSLQCLREATVSSGQKYRKIDVDHLQQKLLCRNYGKTCLALSYLLSIVVCRDSDVDGMSALLNFFWLDVPFTPSRFRTCFEQEVVLDFGRICRAENGVSIEVEGQIFHLSSSNMGHLSALFEWIVFVDPTLLNQVSLRLSRPTIKGIKEFSSDIQKIIYEYLGEHLEPAQQQKRFRLLNEWCGSKSNGGPVDSVLDDDHVMVFWKQHINVAESGISYRRFRTVGEDFIALRSAILTVRDRRGVGSASPIGENSDDGEVGYDQIYRVLDTYDNDLNDLSFLAKPPKFLTQTEVERIASITSVGSGIGPFSATILRMNTFGAWQELMGQALKSKDLDKFKARFKGEDLVDYHAYRLDLNSLRTKVDEAILLGLGVLLAKGDIEAFSVLHDFVGQSDLEAIEEIQEEMCLDHELVETDWPVIIARIRLKSNRINQLCQSAESKLTMTSRDGFKVLPNDSEMAPYHEGIDTLRKIRQSLSDYSQWLEKAVEQQLEFHSDVKCFTDTLMIAYGEYL